MNASQSPNKRYYAYEYSVKVIYPLNAYYSKGQVTNGFTSEYVEVFDGEMDESLKESGESIYGRFSRVIPKEEVIENAKKFWNERAISIMHPEMRITWGLTAIIEEETGKTVESVDWEEQNGNIVVTDVTFADEETPDEDFDNDIFGESIEKQGRKSHQVITSDTITREDLEEIKEKGLICDWGDWTISYSENLNAPGSRSERHYPFFPCFYVSVKTGSRRDDEYVKIFRTVDEVLDYMEGRDKFQYQNERKQRYLDMASRIKTEELDEASDDTLPKQGKIMSHI